MNKNFKYNCGDLLKDKVSGTEGVVMVRAEYSTGCHHYGIQQQGSEKGKGYDWIWLDQSQLTLSLRGAVSFEIDEETRSGPMPEGPSY